MPLPPETDPEAPVRYWKGLLIAVVCDMVTWVACHDLLAPRATPLARTAAVVATAAAFPPELSQLSAVDRAVDSLMLRLQEAPEDIATLIALARLDADQGWFDHAIGPLAR